MLATNPHSNRLLKRLTALVDTTAARSPSLDAVADVLRGCSPDALPVSQQDAAQTLVCSLVSIKLAEMSGYVTKLPPGGCSPLASQLVQAAGSDAKVASEVETVVTDLCHVKHSPADAEQWWLHLYESMLHKQQAKRRKQHGVYYTPREVVRYMVRQVHEILQHEFDLPLGLAATLTWKQAATKYGLTLPAGVDPASHFVQMLDPAAGTGAFVLEMVDHIHATMVSHYRSQNASPSSIRTRWKRYVNRHLLPRLHAWERMPTACALLHLHVALKLAATGYTGGDAVEEGNLRCTDTLKQSDGSMSLTPVVLLGNPPFGRQSQHLGAEYEYLLAPLRTFGGERIRERGAIVFERDINNDYVKFLSFAQWCGERTPAMVASLITPASYLDGRNFRGLRETLLQRFPAVAITHLGGDRRTAGAASDANVFPIEAGVCIAAMQRLPQQKDAPPAVPRVSYTAIRGAAPQKLAALEDAAHPWSWQTFRPAVEQRLSLVPAPPQASNAYQQFTPLGEIFALSVDGIKTSRDGLLTALTPQACAAKMRQFLQCKTAAQVQQQFRVATTNWDWQQAQRHVAATFDEARIIRLAYRPLDFRYLYYDRQLVFSDRYAGMQHLMQTPPGTQRNVAVVCASRLASAGYEHALAADCAVEMKYASHNTNSRVHAALQLDATTQQWRSNISPTFARQCGRPENTPEDALDIAAYVLAVLHLPGYRQRYEHALKDALPRIPAPYGQQQFTTLTRYGHQLINAYLLKRDSSDTATLPAETVAPPDCRFVAPRWSDGWIEFTTQHRMTLDEATFRQTVAGYQVARTWFSAGSRIGGQRKGHEYCAVMHRQYQEVLGSLGRIREIIADLPEFR